MKAHRDKNGGILLLGIKRGGGAINWGRSGSSVLKFVFQVDSLVHIRVVTHTYTVPTCAGPSGT